MISSGSYGGEKEDNECMHRLSRSVLSILIWLRSSGSMTTLCIPYSIVMEYKCRCPVVCDPMIIRDLSEVARCVYRNKITSRPFGYDGEVESACLSGRCQPRCLHNRRRVHVDQSCGKIGLSHFHVRRSVQARGVLPPLLVAF